MVSRAKIKELMNESACSHSKDKKPGEGCDKPKPGLAAGGCAFDGAQISLFALYHAKKMGRNQVQRYK